MTDIEQKALALVNEVRDERGFHPLLESFSRKTAAAEALYRAIEQHEATKRERDDLATAIKTTAGACADHVNTIIQLRSELADFQQKVSNAVALWWSSGEEDNFEVNGLAEQDLLGFIIHAPKPDPLVEAIRETFPVSLAEVDEENARDFVSAIAKRGGKIVWEQGE